MDVLNGWPFIRWLINSFIVTTGAVFVSLTVSLFAAFSFSRLQWRGRDVVFVIFLTSMFVPWEINAIPIFLTRLRYILSFLDRLGQLHGVACILKI